MFGSVARGDARPDSDIDLAIDFTPGREPSLLALAAMKEDLAARTAMKPRVAEATAGEMVRVF